MKENVNYIVLPRIFTVTVSSRFAHIQSENCLHVMYMNSLKARRCVQVGSPESMMQETKVQVRQS